MYVCVMIQCSVCKFWSLSHCILQQEPFDIDGSLLSDLTMRDKRALDQYLRSFPDLESLLGTMCEFVEAYLRHNITEQHDWT